MYHPNGIQRIRRSVAFRTIMNRSFETTNSAANIDGFNIYELFNPKM